MTKILLGILIIFNILSFGRFEYTPIFYNLKFIFTLLLLFLILGNLIIRKEILYFSKKIFFLFYTWLLIMSMSLIFSFNFYESFPIFVSYILLFILALILLPHYMNLNENNFLSILKVFYWAFLIALLIIIVFGLNDGGSYYEIGDRARYQSYFINPNFLGLFSFGGILCSMSVYLSTKNRNFLVVILFYTFLIYLSDSRTPLYLTIIIIILIISFKCLKFIKDYIKKPYFILLIKIFKLIVFSILILTTIQICVNINSYKEMTNNLISNRLFFWTLYLGELNWNTWLFGKGLGFEISGITFDNYYIKTIVETGIFSFSILIIILSKILYLFYKRISLNGQFNIFSFYTFTLIISIYIYSLFENILFTLGNSVSIFFWTYVGYQLLQVQRKKDLR